MEVVSFDPVQAADYGVFVEYAYQMFAEVVNAGEPGNLTPTPISDFGTTTGCEIVAYLSAVDTFIEGQRVFYGFVARYADAPGQLVVAIRGTADDTEWFDDFEVWPVAFEPIPAAGEVEHGFYEIFSSIQALDPAGQPLDPYGLAALTGGAALTSVTIVGHSLGGALATMYALMALQAEPVIAPLTSLYTLAAPSLGDEQFFTYYTENGPPSVRIYNTADIVPIGLNWLYTQVPSAGVALTPPPELCTSLGCEHALLSYLWMLDPNNHFISAFTASGCYEPESQGAVARRRLLAKRASAALPA